MSVEIQNKLFSFLELNYLITTIVIKIKYEYKPGVVHPKDNSVHKVSEPEFFQLVTITI